MFEGCTNLTVAPELPATHLFTACYSSMFSKCEKINYIKMLAKNNNAEICLSRWTQGVSTSGIFVKNIEAIWAETGESGTPINWTILYFDITTGKYYKDKEMIYECDDHGYSL